MESSTLKKKAKDAFDKTTDYLSDAKDSVTENVGDFVDDAKDNLSKVKDKAKEGINAAGEAVQKAYSRSPGTLCHRGKVRFSLRTIVLENKKSPLSINSRGISILKNTVYSPTPYSPSVGTYSFWSQSTSSCRSSGRSFPRGKKGPETPWSMSMALVASKSASGRSTFVMAQMTSRCV